MKPIAIKIFSGVPQGSVLGPKLINLFINNLPERIMSSCYGYADDYKVVDTNSLTLQIDASRIWQRCFQKKMKKNRAKNKLVSIMMGQTYRMEGSFFFLKKKQNSRSTSGLMSFVIFLEQLKQKKVQKTIKDFWSIERISLKSRLGSKGKNSTATDLFQ